MKPLTTLAALLAAAPALAHDGAHLHPHGFEAALALGLVVAGAVAVVLKRSL